MCVCGGVFWDSLKRSSEVVAVVARNVPGAGHYRGRVSWLFGEGRDRAALFLRLPRYDR